MDRRCYRCHAVLPPAKATGRRQRYCTRACRDAAYYLRRHAEDSDMGLLIEDYEALKVEVRLLKHDLRAAHEENTRLRALVPPDQARPF